MMSDLNKKDMLIKEIQEFAVALESASEEMREIKK